MAEAKPIDGAVVREWLDYNEHTGVFVWRKSQTGRIKPGSVAGSYHSDGYRNIRVLGRLLLAHRIAFAWMGVSVPAGMDIDHINGVKDDNRWANLRILTRGDNRANNASHSTKSGYRGVDVRPCGKRYRARIRYQGRCISLGDYPTPELAHEAFLEATHTLRPGVLQR